MRVRTRIAIGVIAALCVAATVSVSGADVSASGQESLAAARELYASAAYDDALKMLEGLTDGGSKDDRDVVQLYRAMCFVALNRKADADRAIQALVTGNPRFRPAADDVSPRVLTAIRDARRRILPSVIQQEYAASKVAFDKQEYAEASKGFRRMLDALNDGDLGTAGGESPLSDLKMLATGFYDLSVKAAVPPPLPAAASKVAPSQVVAKMAPAVDTTRVYTSDDAKVVGPSVVRQNMPTFRGRVTMAGKGIVELIIDETGQVADATMRVPLAPMYNEFILSAVRTWQYRPATLDNVPVKFRKLVQVNLEGQ